MRLGRQFRPLPNHSWLGSNSTRERGKALTISVFAIIVIFKHLACARRCAKFFTSCVNLFKVSHQIYEAGTLTTPPTQRTWICSTSQASIAMTAAFVGGRVAQEEDEQEGDHQDADPEGICRSAHLTPYSADEEETVPEKGHAPQRSHG